MGLIVDTGIFVAAERAQLSMAGLLESIQRQYPREELSISVMTLLELSQGIPNPRYAKTVALRQLFIQELRGAVPAVTLTDHLALRAGTLNGILQAKGANIGPADVVIAATALDLGCGVLTYNVKHFSQVPGLRVVTP